MKSRRKSIEKILEEEAELFEKHKDDPNPRPWGRPKKPEGEVGQVYSLRIPVQRLAELRRVADAYGEQPTGLMRQWILERLDRELRKGVAESAPPYGARVAAGKKRPARKKPAQPKRRRK